MLWIVFFVKLLGEFVIAIIMVAPFDQMEVFCLFSVSFYTFYPNSAAQDVHT